MADAASPGSARGNATRVNACMRLQPKTVAASSNSLETPMKTLLVTRIVVGRAIATCSKATLISLSYRSHCMKVTANGMERMTIGKARVERIMMR